MAPQQDTVTVGSSAAPEDAPDWKHFRRESRSLLGQLPPGLRRDIAKIRRDDMRVRLAEEILHHALAVAHDRSQTIAIKGLLFDTKEVVPAVHLRTIMRELDNDRCYRGRIRREVRQTLRSMHLVKVDPALEPMTVAGEVFGSSPREPGPWEVEADVGLGTASFMEVEPEAWDVWVVRRILARYEGSNRRIDICALGAGPGGIARAVASLAPEASRLFVHEVDWLVPQRTNFHRVSGRDDPLGRTFQSVVMVLPCPAVGAGANHRGIYSGEGKAGHRPYDVGWLGPKRWKQACKHMLGWFAELLAPGAIGHALLPLGVRVGGSYEDRGDLLDELLDHAEVVGLKTIDKIDTVEVGSVNQPFLGTNRCRRLTVIFERVVADEDGEVSL